MKSYLRLDFSTQGCQYGGFKQLGPSFMVLHGGVSQARRVAVFQCVCGNTATRDITSIRQNMPKGCKSCAHQGIGKTHGASKTGEYRAYSAMIQRCYGNCQVSQKTYRDRGITIFNGWLGEEGFKQFIKDVGLKPSPNLELDRYPDRFGNYEPGNVRWATRTQNQRNRTSCRMLQLNGTTKCLKDWADEYGLGDKTVKYRLARGLSLDEALNTPLRSNTHTNLKVGNK